MRFPLLFNQLFVSALYGGDRHCKGVKAAGGCSFSACAYARKTI
ncbi:hypothetical protein DFQ01_14524 [Paenibacillus cellulosilyticus]|uniref:Uncharacterized protein n=1 Tax=Paenibacillus cellulosilyticus TaxID=375489 RepID=A0A2V2YD76_9BACL|nr:hypothetical protein DFQ01_14524 [Paenibacillus cellulosilyticus]